jgi:2-polyprenyl-3-methyl-5-hydroxy-6-metoxy-1,4-benzoquinol methylase
VSQPDQPFRSGASAPRVTTESILARLRSHLQAQPVAAYLADAETSPSATSAKVEGDPGDAGPSDLRALLAAGDPAHARVSGPTPVRILRGLLARLLYPLHRHQHELAAATVAAINALQQRIRALERRSPSSRPKPRSLPLDFKALEDELRGDEEWLKRHQSRYLRHFAAARDVLDVGCGRGEFLELLRESNVPAIGVDVDGGMVAHCRSKGLAVEQSDAFDFLAGLEPASLGGIFCAQMLEHLEAVDAIALVGLCARALRPEAALVIETPNPESLIVFSAFYQDLSHVRPYHPRSLIPLFRSHGFRDVDVEYSLRPDPELWLPPLPPDLVEQAPALDRSLQRLSALLYGPLNFAVVGRRVDGTSA